MLEIKTEEPDGVVITAAGELTEADYERFVTAFERIAEERSPKRVLVELEEFRGWAVTGL